MIRCEHCKKKYNEVKVLIDGTKICYKCYSMELDNENYKLRQFILLTLPTPYRSNLFKETYGKGISSEDLIKYLEQYIQELKWEK